MQFQVRKAVAGAAALAFDLEMPGTSCVTDLSEALARAPSVVSLLPTELQLHVLNRSSTMLPSDSEVQIVSWFQIEAVDEARD